MINVKKGTAHGLQQSDFIGTVTVDPITRAVTPVLVQGQIVHKHATTGAMVLGLTSATAEAPGFCLSNTVEGDVIESGKAGAYNLDGNSIIETDQVFDTINTTNFPNGAPVYAIVGSSNAGSVTMTATSNKLVGTVDGIRTIRGTTVLGIKLN